MHAFFMLSEAPLQRVAMAFVPLSGEDQGETTVRHQGAT
jgi:hypothetical protein